MCFAVSFFKNTNLCYKIQIEQITPCSVAETQKYVIGIFPSLLILVVLPTIMLDILTQ